MSQLVVGHTSSDSAWIWVRGERGARHATIELRGRDGTPAASRDVELDAAHDYVAVARFDVDAGLAPDAPYQVIARFDGRGTDPVCGQLRTFPPPGSERAFHFLHGSCNLPTARLTALGSLAVGVLGTVAARKSLELPVDDWDTHRWPRLVPASPGFRRLYRSLVSRLAKLLSGAVVLTTRYRLPKPVLPSPFAELADSIVKAEPEARPAFMIHAGDQIYFDVDFDARPVLEGYRTCYRQAWFEDEPTAQLLRSLPHYMILDDHEIVDGFGNDPDAGAGAAELAEQALAAYEEYVACRQPSDPKQFFYAFEHGSTPFFVLDTRTQRSPGSGEMIDAAQLAAFERWLEKDPGRLKFAVSSVPFVAQLRAHARGRDRSDKWSGPVWRRQRDRILSVIHTHGVERLVFLTGDMHCTYHATLRIGPPSRRVTVHELAGGPIHQLLFANREDFHARLSGRFRAETGEVPWTSTLEAFHGAAPGVLRISVRPKTAHQPLEVDWEVVRTRTRARRDDAVAREETEAAPLRGRIRFPRARGDEP